MGNYPGITVEKKEGFARFGADEARIVDLPGTYSLTAYSQEELVARQVLAEERPDSVIDVLNAGTLERNLYLAVQLMELGAPVILALNMMDEARRQGLRIDSGRLSHLLGVPVVETVARRDEGVHELLREAVKRAEERRGEPWVPLEISYGPDLDPVLEDMTREIAREGFLADRYPPRWVALKYLESDEEIRGMGRKAGPLSQTLEARAAKVAEHCQATLKTYPEAVIADYRYGFIASLLKQGVLSRSDLEQRLAFSDRLDQLLTQRALGPIIMLFVLLAVYQVTFTVGEAPLGWMEAFFGWLAGLGEAWLPEGALRSLVVSGIIDGVGGVLSFVPIIMIMFLLVAFLEDTGYMARVAYMLDRVFRTFGLHGCSVMPFILSGGIGGGCAVPGVLASRTLRSPREKLATMLTAPFMTCGAKLPVLILLTGVFFPGRQALAMFAITLFAWIAALLVAKFLRSTVIRGPATPFVMELPPYRLPTLKGLAIHTWERTWQYIKKAGTVILAISILLWAAMSYPNLPEEREAFYETRAAELAANLEAAPQGSAEAQALSGDLEALAMERGGEELRASVAGRLGRFLEPVSRWAGFEWRMNIALVGGFAAKEVIVSTLGTAYSLGEVEAEDAPGLKERLENDPDWTMARGIAVMLFILLYAPCFVTVAVIKQESGSWGWALFSTGFNTALAFVLAVLVFQGLSLA